MRTFNSLPLVPAILTKHDEIEVITPMHSSSHFTDNPLPIISSLHLPKQELLESYLIDFNALESKIEYVRSQIQNAEELVSAL